MSTFEKNNNTKTQKQLRHVVTEQLRILMTNKEKINNVLDLDLALKLID